MTIGEWVDVLEYGNLDDVKDRPDVAELIGFLEELKRSREFTSEYCGQNRTISQCLKCVLYEHGLCVDERSATRCREHVKIVINQVPDKDRL